MNTINKLLKITGVIGWSCVCLTVEADPKAMTLEEIKEFFEREKQEADRMMPETLQKMHDSLPMIIKEATKKSSAPRKGDGQLKLGPRIKVENALSKFISDCFIRKVSYNENNGSFDLEVERFYGRDDSPIGEVPFPVCEERLCAGEVKKYIVSPSSLEAISEAVTKEELQKRGITNEEMNFFGNSKIREITFQSILSSDIFDSQYKDKASALLNDKELLKNEIEKYANSITILQGIPVKVKERHLNLKIDIENGKDILKVEKSGLSNWNHYLFYASKELSVRKYIAEVLKDCLLCKTGPEKIILFLLFCERTSPEERLQWCESNKFGYRDIDNRMLFPRDRTQYGSRVILHEIGHYLEQCLGFKQTSEGYRNPFAKKLLLLKNEHEKDSKVFVPKLLRKYFQEFLQDSSFEDEVLNDFSESDLFMYWQLYARWQSKHEISNILGVYFEKDPQTIYINTLSDIQGLQRVRYGHAYGPTAYNRFCLNMILNKKSDELEKFKKQGGLSVIIDADCKKIDPKVLHLLCKLHKREFNGDYLDYADVKKKDDVAKMRCYISEYKSSNE